MAAATTAVLAVRLACACGREVEKRSCREGGGVYTGESDKTVHRNFVCSIRPYPSPDHHSIPRRDLRRSLSQSRLSQPCYFVRRCLPSRRAALRAFLWIYRGWRIPSVWIEPGIGVRSGFAGGGVCGGGGAVDGGGFGVGVGRGGGEAGRVNGGAGHGGLGKL